MDDGRFSEARAQISEIRELDADHPTLIPLLIDLSAAEHAARWRRGPKLVAATVFGVLVLAASLLENAPGLRSYPMVAVVDLVQSLPPIDAGDSRTAVGEIADPEEAPIATTGTNRVVRVDFAISNSPAPGQGAVSRAEFPSPVRFAEGGSDDLSAAFAPNRVSGAPSVALTSAAVVPPPPVQAGFAAPPTHVEPPPAVPIPLAAGAAVMPASTGAIVRTPPVNDDQLVRLLLQRYRSAYEGLDANSARAVWPTVDMTALNRAFRGLESQRLSFEDCDVQLRGTLATAVCRGSAEYVPRVGSRVRRVEPRLWSFTLRKAGSGEWLIDSARAN